MKVRQDAVPSRKPHHIKAQPINKTRVLIFCAALVCRAWEQPSIRKARRLLRRGSESAWGVKEWVL